jgi:hypothetical protein
MVCSIIKNTALDTFLKTKAKLFSGRITKEFCRMKNILEILVARNMSRFMPMQEVVHRFQEKKMYLVWKVFHQYRKKK